MSTRRVSIAEVEALVSRYLPIYHLHLFEDFGPMNIDEYVRQCILWADNDTSGSLGDNFKKVTLILPGNIPNSNPDYGDLTLNLWTSAYRQFARQQRGGMFLDFAGWADANDLLLPYEQCNPKEALKKYGAIKNRGSFSIYAHVSPASLYADTSRMIKQLRNWSSEGRIDSQAAANLEHSVKSIYEKFIVVSFSPFFCMQNWKDKGGYDNHESDFEDGALVVITDTDQLDARYVQFSRHERSAYDRDIRAWPQWLADETGLEMAKRDHDHVHAFIALGGHAHYPEAGFYDRPLESAVGTALSIPVVNVVTLVLYCIFSWFARMFGADAPQNLSAWPNNDDASGGGIVIGQGGVPWQVSGVADRFNDKLPAWWDDYNGFWGVKVRSTVFKRDGSGVRFSEERRMSGQYAIDDAVEVEIQRDEELSRRFAQALTKL